MGYYLQLNDEEPECIASTAGWSDVRTWADTLPPKSADTIHHFIQFGWEEDAGRLLSQLKSALKSHPPERADTASTLTGWISVLTDYDGDVTVVSLTDGLG